MHNILGQLLMTHDEYENIMGVLLKYSAVVVDLELNNKELVKQCRAWKSRYLAVCQKAGIDQKEGQHD